MEKGYLLNVDWLTVNYDSPVALSDADFEGMPYYIVKKQPYSTRHFRDVYELYADTSLIIPVATVVANPFSLALYPPTLIQIKVANNTLYNSTDEECDAIRLYRTLEDYFQLEFRSISRLDLCVDTHNFNLSAFLNLLREKEIQMKSNRKVQEYYMISEDDDKQLAISFEPPKKESSESNEKKTKKNIRNWATKPTTDEKILYEGVKFGTTQSDYTFKIYNKSKEIMEESKKYYILKYWKDNGFDETKIVWRFEFAITKFEKLQMSNGKVVTPHSLFCDFDVLRELFSYYLNKVECRYNTGEERFDRRPIYPMLPESMSAYPKPTKLAPYDVGENIQGHKVLIGKLMDRLKYGILLDTIPLSDVAKRKKFGITREMSYNIAKTIEGWLSVYDLWDWFSNKYGKDTRWYAKKYNWSEYRTALFRFTNLFEEEFVLRPPNVKKNDDEVVILTPVRYNGGRFDKPKKT